MAETQTQSCVHKVLISPKLEGKAGREHLAGILSYLDEGHVWDVRIARADSDLTPDAVCEALDKGTEGFLLSVVSSARQSKVLEMLAKARANVVIIDNYEPRARSSRFAYVRFNTKAIVAAGLKFIEKAIPGADVAFVPAPSHEAWSTAREKSFRSLTAKRTASRHIYDSASGETLAAWLASLPSPTGVLAANDMTALLVVETCAETGINVPERLTVLGIDNDELICGHTRPPIATIEPNFAGAGFIAAATLQSLMDNRRTPREIIVNESVNRIVARQSARPLGEKPFLLRRAMDLIHADAAKLNVCSLASALGVSRTKLADAFAKCGTSIAAEIRNERFSRVFKLLSNPYQAIGPIANLCGWKSETHLMHSFRRRTGMTMRDWRSHHLSSTGG